MYLPEQIKHELADWAGSHATTRHLLLYRRALEKCVQYIFIYQKKTIVFVMSQNNLICMY